MTWILRPTFAIAALAVFCGGCGSSGKSDGSGGTAGVGGSSGGSAGSAGMAGGAGLAGTAGAGGMAGGSMIPDGVINEQRTHTTKADDVDYDEEVPTFFRTTAELPDLDVRDLHLHGSDLYAATASGLAQLDAAGDAFDPVAITGSGPVVGLASFGDRLVAARADEVHVLTAAGAPGEVWAAPGGGIRAVGASATTVFIGSDNGLSTIDAGGVTAVGAAAGIEVRALVTRGDVVWMATSQDVRRYDSSADALLPDLGVGGVAEDIRAITITSDDTEVLAATNNGLWRIDTSTTTITAVNPGIGSLPNGDLTSVSEAGGTVLTGHAIGATAMSATARDHYHTVRWILDPAVTDVVLQPDGTRWIATNVGVTRIDLVSRTLADKAALMESLLDKHWRMDGFVDDQIRIADPWDLQSAVTHSDHDNDGLWSEMQVAAWCFAYAATGNTEFYDKARRALDVMLLLYDVPAETFRAAGRSEGFITRSLVRSDEGAIFDDKATQSNWHLQEHGGQTYYWKDDTSSDEYAGHFFGIPVFYDLCAQSDAEKQEIATRVQRVMEYLIENDYLLIDLDGEPTSHGDWQGLADAVDGVGPCLMNMGDECIENFGGGGWLNSIEILGHLLAAWHITGDDQFYAEYERLAIDERYGEMVPVQPTTATVTSRRLGNHSDHELATLAYFTLLRYEPNPERRAIWIQSVRDFFQYEEPERIPFEIAMMASAIDDPAMDLAVRSLREMPLDWREPRYDNSHRRDYEVDNTPGRFNEAQFTAVPPYDEIRTMKWNGNPYVVVGGSNESVVQAPWPWLLPYWMLQYYGALD